MLYPENGDRVVTIDSVTSPHPIYRRLSAVFTLAHLCGATRRGEVRRCRGGAASSGARRRCSPFRAPPAVRPGKPPPTRLASRYRLPTPPQTGARHAEAIDCYSVRCAVESATIDKAVVDSRLRPPLPGAAFWRASLSIRKKVKVAHTRLSSVGFFRS